MQQFDVCRLRENAEQLVVVLQNDIADELSTRIVAPLSDAPFRKMIADVRLPVEIEGVTLILQLDRLAAIEEKAIGSPIGNLSAEEYRIKRALDLLFLGV